MSRSQKTMFSCSPSSSFSLRFSSISSSLVLMLPLYAHHRSEGVHDLDQIFLRLHHRVNVLVGSGCLVDQVRGLPAFDSLDGLLELFKRDPPLCCTAGHYPTSAVGARLEALRVSLPHHDVALGAHGTRDDTHLPEARAHRALPGHHYVLAIVGLDDCVVVVAVDSLLVHRDRNPQGVRYRQDSVAQH